MDYKTELTTVLTICNLGLRGNSANESARKHRFRTQKPAKCLKMTQNSRQYRFGSKMSQVQILSFRPKKQLSLVVWLLFCLVCQFETVRVANAGSHTAGITKRSVVTLSFRPKNTVEKDTFSAVFLSIAKAMAYHHDLACISSPQAYIISRRLYSLSQ